VTVDTSLQWSTIWIWNFIISKHLLQNWLHLQKHNLFAVTDTHVTCLSLAE